MDTSILPTAAILAVICVGFVIAAMTRPRKHLEVQSRATDLPPTEGASAVSPARRDGSAVRSRAPRTQRWAVAIALVSLLASAGLGYAVYDQGQKLRDAEATLDAKIEGAEKRLAGIVATAIARVPNVDAVKRDLKALETKLFGISSGVFQRDVLGSLERDVASAKSSVTSLGFDLSSFKTCMNRALSNALSNYDRAGSNYYGGTYYVPKCY